MFSCADKFLCYFNILKSFLVVGSVVGLLMGCSVNERNQTKLNKIDQTENDNRKNAKLNSENPFPERLRINMYYAPRWQKAILTHAKEDRFTLEFWPYGQKKSFWKEIIQVNYYDKSVNGNDIESHLDKYKHSITEKCPTTSLKSLEESETDKIYLLKINDCDKIEQQYEIGRFIKTQHGIHHMIYASKGEVPAEKYFNRWLRAVKAVEVINAEKYATITPTKDLAWRR